MVDLSYNEIKVNLETRINIHSKYSQKEINDWILVLMEINKDMNILDIACGSGKQIIAYAKNAGRNSRVIGLDISSELLNEAKNKILNERYQNIELCQHDANNALPFDNDLFERISFCFGIYYLRDIKKCLFEVKRVLKNNGRIVVIGPSAGNAFEIFDAQRNAIGKAIPETALLRTIRMEKEILPIMKDIFGNVRTSIFINKINFPSIESVMDYYKSSLLFEESVKQGINIDELLEKMLKYIGKIINEKGEFILTKEVIGVISEKNISIDRV